MPTTTLGRRVEHAHLAFVLALQHQLGATGSACWSPYSVASALGLAATGAAGENRVELVQLLMGAPDADPAEHGARPPEAAPLPADRTEPALLAPNPLWHLPGLPSEPPFAAE